MRPAVQNAKIKSLKFDKMRGLLVEGVTLLSTGEELSFERDEEKMTIKASESFESKTPICFKIRLS